MPLLLLLLLPFALLLALPFSIIQRYRVGKARRVGRRWLATLNLLLMIFSAAVFAWAAALTNLWLPYAFARAVEGMLIGVLVALIGLALTRWEHSDRELHYTPNRWLVLLLTLAVAGRILYGFLHAWRAWSGHQSHATWLQDSGLATSLGVGGLVLGYYLAYAAGVLYRINRHGSLAPR
ncbi:MAG: hypothetical protein ACJ8JD_04405 [Chthoniobacterales bacterium]